MTTTSRGRKLHRHTWQRELVRALQMIRMVAFLQKLSRIDDIMKYCDIPVSWYFLIWYIIIGHFFNTTYRYYADEQPVLADTPS